MKAGCITPCQPSGRAGQRLLQGLLITLAIVLSSSSLAATKRKAPRKPVASVPAPPTPLRVQSISQLPAEKRQDFQMAPEHATTGPSLFVDGCPLRGTGRVAPCLGLQEERNSNDLRVRFELSRVITGAPKGPMFSPCARSGSEPCGYGADLQTDQERLAEMLNQGKRTPQANLGLELNF